MSSHPDVPEIMRETKKRKTHTPRRKAELG